VLDGNKWDPSQGLECIVEPDWSLDWDKRKAKAANKANPTYQGQPVITYTLNLTAFATGVSAVDSSSLQVFHDLLVKLTQPVLVGTTSEPASIAVEGIVFALGGTTLVRGEKCTAYKWDPRSGKATARVTVIEQVPAPIPINLTGVALPTNPASAAATAQQAQIAQLAEYNRQLALKNAQIAVAKIQVGLNQSLQKVSTQLGLVAPNIVSANAQALASHTPNNSSVASVPQNNQSLLQGSYTNSLTRSNNGTAVPGDAISTPNNATPVYPTNSLASNPASRLFPSCSPIIKG
jgi:hypothetical protein